MAARRNTVTKQIEDIYNDPNLSRREKAQKKRELEELEAKKIRNQGQDRGIIKSLVEINQQKELEKQQRYREYDEQLELERRLARQESLSESERQRLLILQQKAEHDKAMGISYERQNSKKDASLPHKGGLPSPNSGNSNSNNNNNNNNRLNDPKSSDEFLRNNTFKRLTKIKCMIFRLNNILI